MMSPESAVKQEHGSVYPVGIEPRLRFASVDEEASRGSSASDVGKTLGFVTGACAKGSPKGDGDVHRRAGPGGIEDTFEEGEYEPDAEPGNGATGSDRSMGSSSSSSCTTVIFGAGAGDSGLVRGKCADPGDNNNSPLSSNHNSTGVITGVGTVAANVGGAQHNNNNSIKARLGEMDEAKFSEFSKFLADSEKDESVATILELLHDNFGLIQRYASGYECKHDKCQYENLHEHFHCHDTFCRGKVLYKKYEIIRHLKWHKKRKESLKYGFYRFSSSDDCSIQYGTCQHNHKHTHYHCVHENCDKVYISTSDVQMHANYHRKHEAIVKNGFQRFRATEDCNTEYCIFRAQRTTHFHCRRENCKYTFKNKADMEKHKTYHLKDEMLLRDGYKKFLKTEDCTYKDCRFSRVCNHIHCMHENCHYVLHSSGQLLSHKRKHERMDTEVDYRRFQMARNLLTKFNSPRGEGDAKPFVEQPLTVPEESPAREDEPTLSSTPVPGQESSVKNPYLELLSVMAEITFRTLPLQMMYQMRLQMLQQMSYEQVFAPENVEMLRNLTMMGNIEEAYLHQLYGGVLGSPVVDAGAGHLQSPASVGQDKPPPAKRKYKPQEAPKFQDTSPEVPLYIKNEPLSSTPPRSKLLSNPTVDYRLLKKEEPDTFQTSTPCSSKTASGQPDTSGGVDRERALLETANFLQFSSSKTLFNRKRGRPRKNHVMEVYNNVQDSPQAIFTSFKLEKSDSRSTGQVESQATSHTNVTMEPERNGVPEVARNLHVPDGGSLRNPAHHYSAVAPSNYGATVSGAPLGGLDSAAIFGNFSQLLERHMREVKHDTVPNVPQEAVDHIRPEKTRNHLKCVVCGNLFETFADIKNHECRGDRAALDKPLLAFPPSLTQTAGHSTVDYRRPSFATSDLDGAGPPRLGGVPLLPPSATQPSRESISLVKTAGTFFPDVNANKLKYA